MAKKKPTKPAPKKAPNKKRPAKRRSVELSDDERRQLVEALGKAEKLDELMKATVDSPFRQLLEKALKPSTARTRAGGWEEKFFDALIASCNVTIACRVAGIDRTTAYDRKKADAAFAAKWNDALAAGVELMEAEAHRRAFEGTVKPIFQGGELAGMVREFSDTLTIFLLKAHAPDKYRERVSVKDETPVKPIDPAARAAAIAAFLAEVQSSPSGSGSEAGVAGDSAH